MGWNTRPTYAQGPDPLDPFALPVVLSASLQAGYSVSLPTLTQDRPVDLIDHPPGVPMPSSQLGVFRLGLAPLGPSRDPQVGAFIRDSMLVAGTLGGLGRPHYVPVNTPDGRIGRFVIGRSPIDWRRAVHKTITPGTPPGAGEVERT